MTAIPLEAFGFKPTYSAAQNDLAGVRWADHVKSNPYSRYFDDKQALYSTSQTIAFEAPLTFEGMGCGHVHESNPGLVDAGTTFRWQGLAGGVMMKAAPVSGPSALRLFDVHMRRFHLDGNDLAGRCFELRSLDDFNLDFSAVNARETCVLEGVVDQLAPTERRDNMNGRLRLIGAALSANARKVFVRSGDLTSNSCKNVYELPTILHKYDDAVVVENGDTCTWEDLTCHYWGSAPQTHRGLRMKAGASPLTCARADDFQWLSPGAGGAEIEGGTNPAHSIDITWDCDNWDLSLLRAGVGAGVRVQNATIAFSAFKASGTYSNQGWFLDVTGWGESYDKGLWAGSFDAAAGVFTAPLPGFYEFGFAVHHDGALAAGSRWDFLLATTAGGSNDRRFEYTVPAAQPGQARGTARVYLEQGHTARLQIRRLSGVGDWTIPNDWTATRFEGCLVK